MTPEDIHEAESLLQRLDQVTENIRVAHNAINDAHGGGKPVGNSYDVKVQVKHTKLGDPEAWTPTLHNYKTISNQRKILIMSLSLQEAIDERNDILNDLKSMGVLVDEFDGDLDDLPSTTEILTKSIKLIYPDLFEEPKKKSEKESKEATK